MLDILRKIAAWKKKETSIRKVDFPLELLKNQARYHSSCYCLSDMLRSSIGPQIIAEFKRKSPSKGIIREPADPVQICIGYQKAGAVALSVLTDEAFFGAHPNDFSKVRNELDLPILRKDFILEEYQVHKSKAMGADIILLIAALLSPKEVLKLGTLARDLGMDVLLELHSEEEMDRLCEPVSLIGVNNRNLDTFEVDTENSKRLASFLPPDIPKIAESGLSGSSQIIDLFKSGFSGFLIGETYMKSPDPGNKCLETINEINAALR